MLDVKRLRMLVELSHRGTIAAVADALSFSPSAVSQQLSVLEKEAGCQLHEPFGRRVRLTPEGEALVVHAEIVLAELERAESSLEATRRGTGGTLRIAAFQSAAMSLVPGALIALDARHPDLRIEVTELEPEVSLPALAAGDFDLVLGEEYPAHPRPQLRSIDREDLFTDELQLVVPTTWAERALPDLAARPFVMEPNGTTARQWSATVCRAHGFEPDVRFTTSDLQLHLRMVENGLVAAIVPDLAGARRNERIAVVHLQGRPIRQVFTATRRGARGRPALASVVAVLRASLEEWQARTSPDRPNAHQPTRAASRTP